MTVVAAVAAAEDANNEAPDAVARDDNVVVAADEEDVAKVIVHNSDYAPTLLSIAGLMVPVPILVGFVKIHKLDTNIKLRLTTN